MAADELTGSLERHGETIRFRHEGDPFVISVAQGCTWEHLITMTDLSDGRDVIVGFVTRSSRHLIITDIRQED